MELHTFICAINDVMMNIDVDHPRILNNKLLHKNQLHVLLNCCK